MFSNVSCHVLEGILSCSRHVLEVSLPPNHFSQGSMSEGNHLSEHEEDEEDPVNRLPTRFTFWKYLKELRSGNSPENALSWRSLPKYIGLINISTILHKQKWAHIRICSWRVYLQFNQPVGNLFLNCSVKQHSNELVMDGRSESHKVYGFVFHNIVGGSVPVRLGFLVSSLQDKVHPRVSSTSSISGKKRLWIRLYSEY